MASCKILPAALVTKEISPKIKLLPPLSRMATPRPRKTQSGSSHDFVVRIRISRTKITAKTVMIRISLTVLLVAMAVSTADPVMALSSPMISRISSTAVSSFSSSRVTVKRALPSL